MPKSAKAKEHTTDKSKTGIPLPSPSALIPELEAQMMSSSTTRSYGDGSGLLLHPEYRWQRQPSGSLELWIAEQGGQIEQTPADFLCVVRHADQEKNKKTAFDINKTTNKPFIPLNDLTRNDYTVEELHDALAMLQPEQSVMKLLPGKTNSHYKVYGPAIGATEIAFFGLVIAEYKYQKETGDTSSLLTLIRAANAIRNTDREMQTYVAADCLSKLRVSSLITDEKGQVMQQVKEAPLFRFISKTDGSVVDFRGATAPESREFLDRLDDIKLDFSASFVDFIFQARKREHEMASKFEEGKTWKGEICPFPNFPYILPGYYDDIKLVRANMLLHSYKSKNSSDRYRWFNYSTFCALIGHLHWCKSRGHTEHRDAFLTKLAQHVGNIQIDLSKNRIDFTFSQEIAVEFCRKTVGIGGMIKEATQAKPLSEESKIDIPDETPTNSTETAVPSCGDSGSPEAGNADALSTILPPEAPVTVAHALEEMQPPLPENVTVEINGANVELKQNALYLKVERYEYADLLETIQPKPQWQPELQLWCMSRKQAERLELPSQWVLGGAQTLEGLLASEAYRRAEEATAAQLAAAKTQRKQAATKQGDNSEALAQAKAWQEEANAFLRGVKPTLLGLGKGINDAMADEILSRIILTREKDAIKAKCRPSRFRTLVLNTLAAVFTDSAKAFWGEIPLVWSPT